MIAWKKHFQPLKYIDRYADNEPVIDLQTAKLPVKLLLVQKNSPGDVVMLTAAVRDLHLLYPGVFLTAVQTPAMAIWQNNPCITALNPDDPDLVRIEIKQGLIHSSNIGAVHFIHDIIEVLNRKLSLSIYPTRLKGDIHLSRDEKNWFSQMRGILRRDVPYWIIDAGCKNDFTCKLWERARYQQVVDALPEITFAQIGEAHHNHEPLHGNNLVNLIGKTDIRQLIRLVYHAAGVITPVSLPMHLSAAVEVHPRYKRRSRPTIVIAGGREPSIWTAYTNHCHLHTCGMLPCCDQGGCWRSRVYPGQVGDGDAKDTTNLCERQVTSASGQIVPLCMDMIPASLVITQVRNYLVFVRQFEL